MVNLDPNQTLLTFIGQIEDPTLSDETAVQKIERIVNYVKENHVDVATLRQDLQVRLFQHLANVTSASALVEQIAKGTLIEQLIGQGSFELPIKMAAMIKPERLLELFQMHRPFAQEFVNVCIPTAKEWKSRLVNRQFFTDLVRRKTRQYLWEFCPDQIKNEIFDPEDGFTPLHRDLDEFRDLVTIDGLEALIAMCPQHLRDKLFMPDKKDGNTPFFFITGSKDERLIRKLVDLCPPHLRDGLFKPNNHGRTPFHCCRSLEEQKLVYELCPDHLKSDLFKPDKFGGTPLHYSLSPPMCAFMMCAFILEHCPESLRDGCFIPNHQGITPLHWVLEQGRYSIVPEYLIDQCPEHLKPNLFKPDIKGNTPFHYMFGSTDNLDPFNMIFDKCPPNLRAGLFKPNKSGMTILRRAVTREAAPLIKLIFQLCPQEARADLFKHTYDWNIFERLPNSTKLRKLFVERFFTTPELYFPHLEGSLFLANFLKQAQDEVLEQLPQYADQLSAQQRFLLYPLLDGKDIKSWQKSLWNTFVNTWDLIPVSERNRVSQQAWSFVEEREEHSFTLKQNLAILFWLFPEDLIKQLPLDRLEKFSSGSWFEDLPKLFTDVSLKARGFQALNEKLHELMDAGDKALLTAQYTLIKDMTDKLQLVEEDDLFFTLIECQCLLEGDQRDPKDPYRIILSHREALSAQKELMITFKHPDLNLDRIRQSTHRITYGDLPKASFKDLQAVFTDLKARIESLPPEERLNIENKVSAQLGSSLYSILVSSQLINDQHIKNWLTRVGEPGQPCDTILYKVRYLVQHLTQQSKEVQPNGLTPQEELFLIWSQSIYNCHSGLREGIGLIYGSLLSTTRSGHEYEQFVQGLTDQVTQNLINHVLMHPKFLREATGASEIEQGNHQTLYLMNRLFLIIGLNHILTFDPSTHVLYNNLIAKDLKTLTNLYFKYFTLDSLVEELQREVNMALTKGGTSTPLMDYFNTIIKVPLGNYCELNDQTGQYELSREGALAILASQHFLNR